MDIKQPSATILIIYGAGGDLTWRKLIPALYNLQVDNWLPGEFAIIGVDAKPMSLDEYRKHILEGTNTFSRRGKVDPKIWDTFSSDMVKYIEGNFDDRQTYSSLSACIQEIESGWGKQSNQVYYFAVPPALISVITKMMGEAGLAKDRSHTRVVVEKPFGRDLMTARDLNGLLTSVFDESQIFRIDHYLGKETVQNILAFRFANALFEPVWDRKYIDHVEITVAETVGVEHRGDYYDHAGALRDMIQNHLLQLLCLVAMEPPVSFEGNEIRSKKVDVLHAIRPILAQDVYKVAARGQYGAGWLEGEHVPSYREEPGVSPNSNTETFAAVKLYVDNWRWQGIPFYLRTGKRMPARFSEITIQFHPVPHQSFPPRATLDWQPNRLIIRIQPEEAILYRFQAKQPGLQLLLGPEDMRFTYREAFSTESPEAYETLLLDVMLGDTTLFMRADQVEAAWAAITPILEAWGSIEAVNFPNYQAGTWGPESAEALISQDGRAWSSTLLVMDGKISS